MNRNERRDMERARRAIPVGRPDSPFEEIPRAAWPFEMTGNVGLLRVMLNERFMVHVCDRGGGVLSLMVQRKDGRDGITWDELYHVKNALGWPDREAVELYPSVEDLVNVANVRHLFILPEGQCMPFGIDRRRDGRGGSR